jgi:hypothetical protein
VLFPEQVDYFGGAVRLVDTLSRLQGCGVFIVTYGGIRLTVASRAEFSTRRIFCMARRDYAAEINGENLPGQE